MRLLIFTVLAVFASQVSADYNNLAWVSIDDKGTRVYDTNNRIKLAIEDNRFIPLAYGSQWQDSAPELFYEVGQISQYELDAYASASLVKGIQQLVAEFSCATYRFNQKKPQTRSCNGKSFDDRQREGKPFQGGQFVNKRMSVSINSVSKTLPNRSYDIYLPSAKEKTLNSLWGAVHELGSFFVRQRDNKDTVLTIYIDAYRLDKDLERGKRVLESPQVVFVVLPRASKIGRQSSEQAAAQYALSDAVLIVPYY
ncbi:hypothetical protein [Vibrio intestinalis]|uniref:hypothetical protein n=1 Tax=Vibrio intestinalis TaxID=2933291 RepID=UPI0021A915FC|nr:hypothetical protein [Vibrio intestinalis]